ncbi:acyl-CoA-binding protein (ACBP)/diazepam binding inhibitor (DBI)/endozepine (EP) [Polyrhizophydium stewartii]|uniref:Acyl-CoA-binding protein (ACBP)/diazepam binding inhibitor (DBI)/endozepine (EP) n=1 Tax=Polyrhizophydium stewartii TaxID=2732419 RepID=A0ABR4N825_9FUNG|nr:Acyl-CoA-binding domain-containing protein 1 [Polyrhizophydium stewartii]
MSLQADFDKAAADVKNLTYKPTNDELLELYGLFKQATVGNNTTAAPGMFDLQGKAKWSAWKKFENLSKEEAQTKYIELVKQLQAKN